MRDETKAGFGLFAWIIGTVVLVGLISVAVWGIRVATAPAKGAGDVVIKNNDANNRIKAQEKFYTMFNGIQAIDENLDTLAATVKAHPNDRIAQTNLDGNVLACHQAVAEYNAETHKITSRDWRDPDLPYEIGGSDPSTDCKPNQEN